MSGASVERVRVDVWLWRARFFKTRTLASKAVEAGAVRRGRGADVRTLAKPSDPVGPGDWLTIAGPRGLVSVQLVAIGSRRGPPAEARALYAAIDGLDGSSGQGHFAGAARDAPPAPSAEEE